MDFIIRNLLALVLLPVLAGYFRALLQVISGLQDANTVWVALASGAACWVIVLLTLSNPMWLCVFGHELTHVVWTRIFGGRVKDFGSLLLAAMWRQLARTR